jgi:hypothetical protein
VHNRRPSDPVERDAITFQGAVKIALASAYLVGIWIITRSGIFGP